MRQRLVARRAPGLVRLRCLYHEAGLCASQVSLGRWAIWIQRVWSNGPDEPRAHCDDCARLCYPLSSRARIRLLNDRVQDERADD